MKVLIVFNHPAPYKVRLFNELAKEIDLEVIFERTKAKNRPDSFYNINQYNFKHTFYKNGYFGNEQSNSFRLRKFIKNHYKDYDLVIMNGYSTITEMRAISYMKKHNRDFVLFINGGVLKNKENFIKARIKRKYISSAKYYFSPCEEADEYLTYYGANKNAIFHYPYSTFYMGDVLGSPLSKEEKKLLREKWKVPNSKTFISASQFIDRKNNEQLIRLFKKIDANLILVGEGELKEKYESIIREENITNVELRPFMKKEELFDLFKACDGFITLSKEDIYGHTTEEALANGLPVVSSKNVISSRHLIKDGENGYLVNIKDNESILTSINMINESMIAKAIKTAKDNTIEATTQHILNAMKEILK